MLEAAALLMLFIFLEASPAVIIKKAITSSLQLGIRHMDSRFKAYKSNFQDPPKDLPTADYHFHTKKDNSIIRVAFLISFFVRGANLFICLNY